MAYVSLQYKRPDISKKQYKSAVTTKDDRIY